MFLYFGGSTFTRRPTAGTSRSRIYQRAAQVAPVAIEAMVGVAPDPSGEARRDRWVWLGIAAGASLALVVARALAPAPGGVGTH